MSFDFVIPYRDREVARVRNCVSSILNQGDELRKIIFVDYGSSPDYKAAVADYLLPFDKVEYIYSHSQGHLWSRSHALNIGIRQAAADYLIIADVDIIYPHDFLATISEVVRHNEKVIFHYRTRYLLQHDDLNIGGEATYHNRRISGNTARGLAVYPRRELEEIEGFDEYFCMWGVEDIELSRRIRRTFGYGEMWIDSVLTFHQWHPSANAVPKGWMEHTLRLVDTGKNRKSFGKLLSPKDRPAMAAVLAEEDREIEELSFTDPVEFSYAKVLNRLTNLKSGGYVKVTLDHRNLAVIGGRLRPLVNLANRLLASLNISYRLVDIETYSHRKLIGENIFALLFYLIVEMRETDYDYYVARMETNRSLTVVFARK